MVNNPIDTPQQREHELLALELFNSSELQAAYTQVRVYWLDLAKPSPDMRGCEIRRSDDLASTVA
jgi:hypothetical protein